MSAGEVARIAKLWDGLSAEEKLAELRQPTGTLPARSSSASSKAPKGKDDDWTEIISCEVVKLRKLARGFTDVHHRASLVDDWVTRFKSRARRYGWPERSIELVTYVVESETKNWPGFGTNIYRAD